MFRGVALGLAIALSGCRKDPPHVEQTPLAAELSGCAVVVRIPGDASAKTACALAEDRRLRIHVPGTEPRAEIIAHPSGRPLDSAARPLPGGELFAIEVPADATSIEIRRGGARATFALTPSPRPSWYAEAQALRQDGKLDEAEALAGRALAGPAGDIERASAEGVLARIALRRGKIDDARSRFHAAIANDERAGLVSDRADDAFALAFLLHKRARRYAEARRVLDEVAPALADYADGRAREPLYRGQVAWETGDTRTASRELARAVELAERIGAEGIARAARQVRAMVACSAGSTQTCVAELREAERELDRTNAPACERAEVGISLGFAELEEAEVTGTIDVPRLGKADERGLAALDAGCPDPYMRAVANEHLAMAAVLKKEATTARARLQEAKALAPEPRIGDAVMWLDIEARIAELEGEHAAALESFDAARALARGAALRTQEWRALVGRGRVLESMKREIDATASYEEAENVLDDVVALVPFGDGRASAAADGSESVRRLADLLVRRKLDDRALHAVRRARARLARSLSTAAEVAALTGAEREKWERSVAEYRGLRAALDEEAASDWKLSRAALDAALLARASKLAALRARLDDAILLVAHTRSGSVPALPPSDLVLGFAEVGAERDGVLFVSAGAKTRAVRVGRITRMTNTTALGRMLLAPAAAEIERATRIRVITDDSLAWLDVHALPFGADGAPLVARAPVVYAADLPEAIAAPSGRPVALVVADPTGDLPSARAEGVSVVSKLGATHEIRPLVGREATAARVREALGSATLFHYAGHGMFRGREGAESALPLAQGSILALGDVLTLGRAPKSVVLSGCEAGRQEGTAGEGAASIAQAFLIAGASTVIAPVHVIDDRSAGALAADLHSETGGDLARALREAQLRAVRDGRSGWESFRAFVR